MTRLNLIGIFFMISAILPSTTGRLMAQSGVEKIEKETTKEKAERIRKNYKEMLVLWEEVTCGNMVTEPVQVDRITLFDIVSYTHDNWSRSSEAGNTLKAMSQMNLKGLKKLGLLKCRSVTDDHVDYILKLPSLTSLDLRGTSVTNDGVDRIKKALPLCKITRHDKK